MRVNKFVAQADGLSRRKADQLILDGRVKIDQKIAQLGDNVADTSQVRLDNQLLKLPETSQTIMLNKPTGYVCSRRGQGAKTIYELLPSQYWHLNLVGRLDKDSSGLLLLSSDGELVQRLTHPSFNKSKVYVASLDRPLGTKDQSLLNDSGVELEDGTSRLKLKSLDKQRLQWQVTMHEGRNRQIRRSFQALGYGVKQLKRLSIDRYNLGNLAEGQFKVLKD